MEEKAKRVIDTKNDSYDIGIEGEAESYKTLDKNLIYLSAGGIVVSLFILRTLIIELQSLQYATLFFVSGVLFSSTLLSSIWSFFSGAKAFRRFYTDKNERKKTSKRVSDYFEWKITNVLNWLSIISFTLGLLTLLTFVALNIFNQQEETMAEEKQVRKIRDTGIGAVLPPEDRVTDQKKSKQSTTEQQNVVKDTKAKGKKRTQENDFPETPQVPPLPEPETTKHDLIEEGVLPPEDPPTPPSPPPEEE